MDLLYHCYSGQLVDCEMQINDILQEDICLSLWLLLRAHRSSAIIFAIQGV